MNIRRNILRFVQAFLALEVLWHLIEVGLAIYDKAWITATALSIHSIVVIMAVYFIGHDHHHHPEQENIEEETEHPIPNDKP